MACGGWRQGRELAGGSVVQRPREHDGQLAVSWLCLCPVQVEPHTVTLIEGDGIGPEISDAVVKILAAAQVGQPWVVHLLFSPPRAYPPLLPPQAPVSWDRVSVEPVRLPDGRMTVPQEVIESMERNKIGLKGT